jgi:hypothetical protein
MVRHSSSGGCASVNNPIESNAEIFSMHCTFPAGPDIDSVITVKGKTTKRAKADPPPVEARQDSWQGVGTCKKTKKQ